MRLGGLFVLGAVGATLAGCVSTGPNEGVGTMGGGRVAATAAGALVGGVAGQSIGRGLDDRDRQRAEEAEFHALDSGRPGSPVVWSGGREGYRGEVIPGPRYRVNNYDCRDYTHRIWTSGEQQVARGTACRQDNGAWRPIS
jgi:surface antigen